jgi:predicted nucleic acid-binding Zn ribbon protein
MIEKLAVRENRFTQPASCNMAQLSRRYSIPCPFSRFLQLISPPL